MAQQCPGSVDVTDIQFKLQSKHKIFGGNTKLRDHVNLLACASNNGLLFVGNPNAPELKAFILPDIIYAKSKAQPVHLRTTKLPNAANSIACNADGSMLAVNYTLQGYGVLDIYHVPSFATTDIKTLYSIRLPDQNVYALHILWNPVLSNIIGVILSNGNFALYTLKDGGAMEMRSLQNQQIQSGCWSPKGKQLVFGHPNGKLQQFKPDLTLAKSIICPPNIHPGPFDTISLHWLSTFQFVASFLQHGEESMPNMYIINAPKGGTPTYINYNDVCYSGSEPRKQQVTFMHIAQWNLLLVTSANGVEIGLLGTKDTNDQPQWVHYMLLDEARIEMPLTEASDETYPIGLALDISPTHELIVGEKKLPSMPVIHVLSTHGHLLCFNFLNLTPNVVNICSPPAPIQYAFDKFSVLNESSLVDSDATQKVEHEKLTLPTIEAPPPPAPTLAFNAQPQMNVAKQTMSAFGVPANTNLFSGSFEQKPQNQNLKFGMPTANTDTVPNILTKPIAQAAPLPATQHTLKPAQPAEVFKPLYTVSPEFAPPPVQTTQQTQQSQYEAKGKSKTNALNLNETNTVIQQMILMQITAFDKEIKQLGQKSKLALNDDPSIMKGYSKRLINLQEIIEQANERDFIKDVQDLRHSLTESYEMLNECRSKMETFKNPDEPGAKYLSLYDCISQRQLKSLQSYLLINQSIMRRLEEQMDIQWSYYQDLVRRNSKSQMRIPCLDGIYQQMTKLKNLITQQQTKFHYIKNVMKQRDLGSGSGRAATDCRKEATQLANSDTGLVSLADSILSMTIHNITDTKSNKLSDSKLNALRNFTNQQAKIKIIKPQRPNRVELTSEVILETKQLIKKKETKDKESKATKAAGKAHVAVKKEPQQQQQQSFKPMQAPTKQNLELQVSKPQQQPEQQTLQLCKPTAPTIGYFSNTQSATPTFAAAQPKPQTSTQFSAPSFGGGNNFLPKTEPTQLESANELSKLLQNANTFKSGAIDNKQNTLIAPKTDNVDKQPPAPAMNFSFTTKTDAADVGKPALNFNATSKGFAGFGQQQQQNTSFNTNKATAVNANTNQATDAPKAFSFGSTFSALTDLNNANKPSAQQNPPANTNPTPTTQPLFGTTTTQPTIFSKQNENQYFAAQTAPFSAASALSKEKITTADAQTKHTTATKDATSAVGAVGPAQTKSEADDAYLKSMNICKPTPKEAVKPKDGNVFSFSLNTENNPPVGFGVMPSETSISKANTIATNIAATATPTPVFGKLTTTTTAEQSTSPFNVANTNVSAFGSTLGATAPATLSTPAAPSTIGGTGASAFSFTNSTFFKQPTAAFQSQAAASNTTTTVSGTATAANVAAPTAVKPALAPTEVAAFTPTTTVAATSLAPTTAITVAAATTILTPTPSPTIVAPTAVSAAPVSGATSPFFSTIAAAKAPGESLFGNLGQPTQAASSVSATAKTENASQPATATNVSAFGGLSLGGQAPAASGGSIFGNSAGAGFGAATGGIFAAAAAASMPTSPAAAAGGNTSTGSIFGNTAVKNPDNTAGSIFGNAVAKPVETTGSIFGNAAVKSADNNTGGSIFGGTPAKNTETVNVFGSPTSANAAVSSGSIFGQSTGGIFASAAAAANKPDSATTPSGFSFVGSAFGAAPNNTAPAGSSIFGGAPAATDPQQQQQANIFSSPASGFGAAANSPFSSFSQGGSSIASTGFGSPTQPQQQQQGSVFSRPVFGGAPSFGSPPAFGAQPSFGGAPTFGSPKGFGSFATPTTTAFSAAPPTQSSNIFEALGSTDTGLSFGNLAQTSAPNAPKPTFGGSSFMNYRA